jgi:hypothetical protein
MSRKLYGFLCKAVSFPRTIITDCLPLSPMIAAGNAQNESTDLRTTSTSDFAKFAAEQRRLLLHLILRLKYV